MFILGGIKHPANPAELIASLREGFARFLTLPSGREVAQIEGAFPALARLGIDLTGASIGAEDLPRKPQVAQRRPGPSVARIDIAAKPFIFENARVDIEASAKNVTFDFAFDAAGRPLMVPRAAIDGRATTRIAMNELRALVLALAKKAALQQGVTVLSVDLDLASLGSRSLQFEAKIKARLFVSATVRLRGRLDIDERLNATLSSTECEGEGMVGGLATGLLRPKLKQLERQPIPLATFALGDLQLSRLEIRIGDPVIVDLGFAG